MGTISPYDTRLGKRYRVRYRKPDHSQTDKRGFRTKKEAELFLASVEISKSRGEYVDESASKVTIGDLGPAWLASQTHLKPSALEPIEIAWRLYVAPRWSATPIGQIRHSDVQTWISQISAGTAKTSHTKPGPRGATTVVRVYGVLASILDSAVKDRRILSNPACGVNLPRKLTKPHPYLSHEQIDLLARSATHHDVLVLTLSYTGLRWGEATGLRVRDVDLVRRRFSVRENAVRVGGKIIVGTPKSHEARTVPFPAFLAEQLGTLVVGKDSGQIVFGGGTTHERRPSTRDGWFVYALRRAKLADPTFPTLTLHDLRHTAASLAVSAGANVKAVQRMLGHASAAMTLDVYADLFDDDLDAVAVALDQARTFSSVGKMWARSGQEPSNGPLEGRTSAESRGSSVTDHGAPTGTRTQTVTILSRLPLPLGYGGAPGRGRTLQA